MTSQRMKRLAVMFWAVLLVTGFVPFSTVRAQSTSPEAIIEAVNALRASRGLQPYRVDALIMAYAQAHAEYQASIHTSTHQHSAGTIPPYYNLQENVAGGDLGWITPEFAVYEIWQDPVHMHTMVEYRSGWIGVGVADDGVTEYYTLEVRPEGTTATATRPATERPGASPTGAAPATTSPPLVPLVTVTPDPNGCAVHVVGYGQSLWAIAIAYGVKINEIRGLNNLAADSTTIYAGQKLKVRCVTITPATPASLTPTVQEVTPSPTDPPATVPATNAPPQGGGPVAAPTAVPAAASTPLPVLMAGVSILVGGTLLFGLALVSVKKR